MHTCTMYDSIQDVAPDVWGCLVTEVDFAMDRRLVTLQQRTLREQNRMWVVVVRDGANEPAAIACLVRFDFGNSEPAWVAAEGRGRAAAAFSGAARGTSECFQGG